ncbi:MAG: hypothetical protein OHK0029_39110 [Armatimonadaceae bacterium]
MKIAAAGSAYTFWKTVQTVSPNTVEEEAARAFKVALIGTPERRNWLKEQLLTEKATPAEQEDAASYLSEFDETPDQDTARAFSFLLYPGEPGQPVGARGANSVPMVGELPELIEKMLEHRPDMAIALARRFPRFRVPACNFMIQAISRVNAQIAVISALPGVLPWTSIFLPASSVADVILLTKNQLVLVMRLAAAHGQRPGYRQVKELVGTFASAFGWRTLARQLAGFVPAGIGLVLKGSIAYSGTVAIGKAALWYYQTGRKPTNEEIQAAYEESKAEARQVAEEVRGAVTGQLEEQRSQKSDDGETARAEDSAN